MDATIKAMLALGRSEDELTFACHPRSKPPPGMFPVKIGESTLHGKGVFATRKVSKAEVLTTYPCHNIVYDLICGV